jgi:nucleoside-diphosphate-sugar epimerase
LYSRTGLVHPEPAKLGTLSKTSWYGQIFSKIPGRIDFLTPTYAGLYRHLAQVYHLMAVGTDQKIIAPRVLLTGASSQIGVFVIPRLVRAGFRVSAVSRKGKPLSYPEFREVEWLNETDALDAAKSCQYLVSAGPLELAQKFLMSCTQAQKAIVFSSSSVETKQQSGNAAERRQIRNMLSLESELRSESENRGVKLVIFRPTLIYGCGLDTNISRLANWINRFGFMPVNGKAAGLRQPVHADDLATVALAAMLSDHDLPPVLNLSGGDTLSYSDMVSRIFFAVGKPARLLRLPQWLFVLLADLASAIKPTGGINSEMVRRQRHHLVFEDQQARDCLNYNPRPFAPVAQDFSLPVIE